MWKCHHFNKILIIGIIHNRNEMLKKNYQGKVKRWVGLRPSEDPSCCFFPENFCSMIVLLKAFDIPRWSGTEVLYKCMTWLSPKNCFVWRSFPLNECWQMILFQNKKHTKTFADATDDAQLHAKLFVHGRWTWDIVGILLKILVNYH